jgi:hypothetical protein
VPVSITSEIIVLCEGDADKNFIDKLRTTRPGFPPIDTLQARGKNFEQLLLALKNHPKVKGVLIVADSHDCPSDTFATIRGQIRSVGGYGDPLRLLEATQGPDGYPYIAVMLLPNETSPGALETLFIQDLSARNDWLEDCVEAFLKCGETAAHGWPPEKAAKSKFQCMVAALHRDDPSRAASFALKDPPVVNIGSACFNSVETRIKEFCAAAVIDP